MVLDLQLKKGTRLKALNLSKLSSVRGTFRPSPCTILLQLLVRCQRPLACARLDVSYNTEPSFTAIDDGFHCVVSGRLALRGSADDYLSMGGAVGVVDGFDPTQLCPPMDLNQEHL